MTIEWHSLPLSWFTSDRETRLALMDVVYQAKLQIRPADIVYMIKKLIGEK